MNAYLAALVKQYGRTGVLLDTNLLLLLFVGTVNRQYITRFKNTSIFTIEDHETLVDLLT